MRGHDEIVWQGLQALGVLGSPSSWIRCRALGRVSVDDIIRLFAVHQRLRHRILQNLGLEDSEGSVGTRVDLIVYR